MNETPSTKTIIGEVEECLNKIMTYYLVSGSFSFKSVGIKNAKFVLDNKRIFSYNEHLNCCWYQRNYTKLDGCLLTLKEKKVTFLRIH